MKGFETRLLRRGVFIPYRLWALVLLASSSDEEDRRDAHKVQVRMEDDVESRWMINLERFINDS